MGKSRLKLVTAESITCTEKHLEQGPVEFYLMYYNMTVKKQVQKIAT